MKPSRACLLFVAGLLFAACGPQVRGDDGGDDGGGPDAMPACTPVAATDVVCDNGIDDDCDGFMDCYDIDCLNNTEAGCPSTECGEASHNAGSFPLPDDGTGTNFYENTLTITGFTPGSRLTDVTKLLRMCVNMEHTWLRDLEISAFSPDGTQVILMMQLGNTGSEVFMGIPVSEPCDSSPSCVPVPGVGYDYCWSPSAGRIDMLPFVNASSPTIHDLPASLNHPADDYAASSTFSPWAGANLNGDWRIRVRDLWGIDNGVIFNWSIVFDQSLISDCGGFPTD